MIVIIKRNKHFTWLRIQDLVKIDKNYSADDVTRTPGCPIGIVTLSSLLVPGYLCPVEPMYFLDEKSIADEELLYLNFKIRCPFCFHIEVLVLWIDCAELTLDFPRHF